MLALPQTFGQAIRQWPRTLCLPIDAHDRDLTLRSRPPFHRYAERQGERRASNAVYRHRRQDDIVAAQRRQIVALHMDPGIAPFEGDIGAPERPQELKFGAFKVPE